ncbi:Fic/DOC family protein [Symbiobacterium terraclitae]|uniref:Fic/DOC family protein n=1 Tax=Symbiobacterium terraclitae TaxID=557451 RepID=UPI0035B52C57
MSDSWQSRYCYPGTNVLINYADIRDPQKLALLEATVVGARLAELKLRPIAGRFDLRHWQAIHRHLFGDLYPFAGKLRDEGITKGGLLYAKPQFIASAADDCLRQLRAEKHLVGLERPAFISRAAHYMTELYAIHPFREGNSRSLREFVRTLGLQAGYEISWPQLPPQSWFDTMRAAFYGRLDSVRDLLDAVIVNREPSHHLMAQYRRLSRGPAR